MKKMLQAPYIGIVSRPHAAQSNDTHCWGFNAALGKQGAGILPKQRVPVHPGVWEVGRVQHVEHGT